MNPNRNRKQRRHPQSGQALVNVRGDRGEILFPDGGAKSMSVRVLKYQNKPGDSHGSHHQGKHKLG